MRVLVAGILACAGLLLGCSSGGLRTAAVSGTVTLNGQPVAEGSITFIPVEGTTGPERGAVIKDGQYSIPQAKGVVVGKNRVELRSIQKSGKKIQDPTKPPGTLIDELAEAFPPECNSKSTLVRDIQAENNTLNFAIDTKQAGK
jgi:hypothetical protein